MELKFTEAKPYPHVRRYITFQDENNSGEIIIRTKFDTYKVPNTMISYFTKLSSQEDPSDYDIDFPKYLYTFIHWAIHEEE